MLISATVACIGYCIIRNIRFEYCPAPSVPVNPPLTVIKMMHLTNSFMQILLYGCMYANRSLTNSVCWPPKTIMTCTTKIKILKIHCWDGCKSDGFFAGGGRWKSILVSNVCSLTCQFTIYGEWSNHWCFRVLNPKSEKVSASRTHPLTTGPMAHRPRGNR